MKSNKMGLSMKSLIADLFQFSSAITRIIIQEGHWGQGYVCS